VINVVQDRLILMGAQMFNQLDQNHMGIRVVFDGQEFHGLDKIVL
jgi:hypothetical protein